MPFYNANKISKNNFTPSNASFTNIPIQNSKISEAIKALTTLGFSAQDVVPVLSTLSPEISIEEMINIALKSMAKKV